MGKFTVVIPLIPAHDRLIRRLFISLVPDQELIQEIILSRSESKLNQRIIEKKFSKMAKSVGLNARIVVSAVAMHSWDGTNRQRGWNLATGEFVAFLDADDVYREGRLSIIAEVFNAFDPDAIVHNYGSDLPINLRSQMEISDLIKNVKIEMCHKGSSFERIVDDQGNTLRIHFAHITVKNNLREFLSYSDRFPGADQEFCLNILKSGCKLLYLDLELSQWSRHRSLRYEFRRFKRKYLHGLIS